MWPNVKHPKVGNNHYDEHTDVKETWIIGDKLLIVRSITICHVKQTDVDNAGLYAHSEDVQVICFFRFIGLKLNYLHDRQNNNDDGNQNLQLIGVATKVFWRKNYH